MRAAREGGRRCVAHHACAGQSRRLRADVDAARRQIVELDAACERTLARARVARAVTTAHARVRAVGVRAGGDTWSRAPRAAQTRSRSWTAAA